MSTYGDSRQERRGPLLSEELDLILAVLKYLRWIFANLDFGPGHEDVMSSMNRRYTEDTGRRVPREYA